MTTRTGIFADTGGTKHLFIGGVLRNVTGTWEILTDPTHQSDNLWTVKADANAVYVTYPPTTTKVMTFQATTDETYAALGIFMGASVTPELATIKFSQVKLGGLVKPLNPLNLKTTWGNVWLSGMFLM